MALMQVIYLCSSCWLGMICSSRLVFESLKLRTGGDGLEVNILMMPLGKDRVMSPVIFTMHLKHTHILLRIAHFEFHNTREMALTVAGNC